jgi:hypothetical protein
MSAYEVALGLEVGQISSITGYTRASIPRMSAFVDDKVRRRRHLQRLGHQSYSPTSDQALRNALGKTWSPRERAKMYALGMSGSPLAISKAKDAPAWQKAAARWWMEQALAITS